jgi:hypothetical protein
MVSENRDFNNSDDRHAEELAVLLRTVLESPGVTDQVARQAAYKGDELPSPLGEYVTKVRGRSYRITDGDIEGLVAGGYSEDAIFEITVIAALGAAAQRLDAGLRAMREAS